MRALRILWAAIEVPALLALAMLWLLLLPFLVVWYLIRGKPIWSQPMPRPRRGGFYDHP